MANKKRDEFLKRVTNELAKRAGNVCSNPECGCQTSGPSSNESKGITIGVAAHICAAAPGGPRYNKDMTPEQRRDINNGIWLCENCHSIIDQDEKYYTVEVLKEWKRLAELKAKDRIGKRKTELKIMDTISGWMGYSNWSNRTSTETPYIIKENSIIYKDNLDPRNKKSILEGINSMRKELLEEKSSIRLAGLSGTGKTRLAQALFDEKIGNNALDKKIVIYGDISDSLKPNPIEYIQQLTKSKRRIILIVDNCESNMHNKLTELCKVEGSRVSLMTIEYDVKEDDNVDSNNYYLGPTTSDTLRELLKRDYSYIEDLNIETIVRYSDGNYRIAIYLAKSIKKGDNIGILKDNQLLERLFYQGDKKDDKMMTVGEVCSLFYSFNNDFEESKNNELNIITKLTNLSLDEVTSCIEKLRQRQIIQKRGSMRAVLPHALANRLASEYLNSHQINNIISTISINNRLIKSFFRRIKNLHSNENALKIADDYLAKLSDEDLINANDTLIEILKCINILHPGKILYRIKKINNEKFFTRDNPYFYEWVLMLGYTAYEEKYFRLSIEMIIRFALSEKKENDYNSIRHVLSNFFHIYLSNTHAPLKERLIIVDELINSDVESEKKLGLALLDEILEFGSTFIGVPIYDIGTKIRDYGIMPKPSEWFEEAFEYVDKLLESGTLYNDVKEVVANNFMYLYKHGCAEILDKLVRKNIAKSNWPRIWVALLALKRMDKDSIPEKYLKKINNLIELVKPSNTKEKLSTYLYGGRRINLGLDVAYNDIEEVNKMVYELGKEVGSNIRELKDNLLIMNNNYDSFRMDYLAKGIYDSIESKEQLIYLILDTIGEDNEVVLKNMLTHIMNLYHNDDSESCNKILEEVLSSEKYKKYFMSLQLSYNLDDKSVERLKIAVEQGLIDDNIIFRVQSIMKDIKVDQIISLLDRIKCKTKNDNVVIDTLFKLNEQGKMDEKLKKYTRKNISELDFKQYRNNKHRVNSYIVSELIKSVFYDSEGEKAAGIIFNKIRDMVNNDNIYFYDFENILEPLIKNYPHLFLDVFINYTGEPSHEIKNFFKGFNGLNANIINKIECTDVIEWIGKTKKDLEISYLLEPYENDGNNNFIWNDLAKYLFENYSDISVIINIVNNIYPRAWENEFSTVMQKRYNMIVYLKESKDKNIKKIGKQKYDEYNIRLEANLEREKKEQEEGFGRFED